MLISSILTGYLHGERKIKSAYLRSGVRIRKNVRSRTKQLDLENQGLKVEKGKGSPQVEML